MVRLFWPSSEVVSLECVEHKSCSFRMTRFHVVINDLLKGAVMDMMWLFALVMGALLIGGLIVYKKSV